MMYTGCEEEDILGLPEEEAKISAELEHSFTVLEPLEKKDNFTPAEPKLKKKPIVIIKGKSNGKKGKSGKSSNLF